MKQYKVVVEVRSIEEFEIEATNDDEAYQKAEERCELDYHGDFDIIDIYTNEE